MGIPLNSVDGHSTFHIRRVSISSAPGMAGGLRDPAIFPTPAQIAAMDPILSAVLDRRLKRGRRVVKQTTTVWFQEWGGIGGEWTIERLWEIAG